MAIILWLMSFLNYAIKNMPVFVSAVVTFEDAGRDYSVSWDLRLY